MRRLLLLLCVAALACDHSPAEPEPGVSYTGTIESVQLVLAGDQWVFVQREGIGADAPVGGVYARLNSAGISTSVVGLDGRPTSFSSLQAGQLVRVLTNGVMLESAPPQVFALRVTILTAPAASALEPGGNLKYD